MSIQKKFTDEEDVEIAKIYASGVSGNKIAEIYGVQPKVVYRAIRRTGTPIRTRSQNKREHKVDQHIFDVIDTPEKAYWWGFMFGDGNTGVNVTRLVLQGSDRKHVEKFKKFLNSDHPITERKTYNRQYNKTYVRAGISVYSQYLKDRLEELGILVKRPKFDLSELPKELYHYWILGLFDADGSVSTSSFPRVIFCGSNRMSMEFVREQLAEHTDKFNKKTDHKEIATHKKSGIYYLYYNGENISRAIYEYMYKDRVVFLERKLEKFMTFL